MASYRKIKDAGDFGAMSPEEIEKFQRWAQRMKMDKLRLLGHIEAKLAFDAGTTSEAFPRMLTARKQSQVDQVDNGEPSLVGLSSKQCYEVKNWAKRAEAARLCAWKAGEDAASDGEERRLQMRARQRVNEARYRQSNWGMLRDKAAVFHNIKYLK
ncbi:hypothetical protein CPB85DRAFT_1435871 [Mucidula mucida]|nr:hypothetical protein CPB85DRAFT_1435871 [Mucidula mucida]